MNMIQIINFAIITGDNIKMISYTFNVLDENGAIRSSNLKRSLPINSDTTLTTPINTSNILEISETIKSYLIEHTVI